jgi:hypothetical protein
MKKFSILFIFITCTTLFSQYYDSPEMKRAMYNYKNNNKSELISHVEEMISKDYLTIHYIDCKFIEVDLNWRYNACIKSTIDEHKLNMLRIIVFYIKRKRDPSMPIKRINFLMDKPHQIIAQYGAISDEVYFNLF